MSKMGLNKVLEKIENIVTEAHKILQLLNGIVWVNAMHDSRTF
jgi:ketopantoate reductase